MGQHPRRRVNINRIYSNLLIRQCSRWSPDSVTIFWTPSAADIEILEQNFKKIKDVVAIKCCQIGRHIKNLKSFSFQYLGIIINGQKLIYINAYHNEDRIRDGKNNLNTIPVEVCDGGDWYWGVIFNPLSKSFFDLAFNGMG